MAGPYTRMNPFPAKVAVNRSLCGQGSEKDTRHFELDLKGWGLHYDVGDSMTVWPTNDPALVDEIIAKIGAKGLVKCTWSGCASTAIIFTTTSSRK